MAGIHDKLPSGLFPFLLMGLLAALTFWLEQTTRPTSPGKEGKLRHAPDYYVEVLTLRRYDSDGSLMHTLHASSMRHFPDDDTTETVAPRLTYHRLPGLFVTAKTAWLNSDASHIRLLDDVSVTRSGVGNKPGSTLTTRSLDAYPDEEIISTDHPVHLVQGRSKVDGRTLRANNKTAHYVLGGPVQGIFYPDRASPANQASARQMHEHQKPRSIPKPKPRLKANR